MGREYPIKNSWVLVKFTELKWLRAMTRGRKPNYGDEDVWDSIKGIKTPINDNLTIIIEKIQQIQLREKGLFDFEVALKGKEVKPCKTLETCLDTLEVAADELDTIVERCAKWLAKRRKARRKAQRG